MPPQDTTPRPPLAAPADRLTTDRLARAGLRSGQVLLVVALAAAVVFALVQLKLVVVPLLIALIVAAALSPIVNLLRKHGVPAILATWITLLSGLVLLGGIVTLIVLAVRDQWGELISSASDGLDQLQDFLVNGPIPVDQNQLEDGRKAVEDFLTSSQFGSGALAGASVAFEVIAGAVLLFVILFFFLKDGGRIWSFFLTPFHGKHLARGHRIGHISLGVLGGYVRGTVVIALVDAIAIGTGLAILGVPLAIPLAVIVFLGAFVPLIGATAAGGIAALVALVANGPIIALIVVAIVIAANQIEGNFLQPVVMAQSLKLHPLVILFALTAGTILGGIVGAVLSVPIAAVAWAIMKVWNEPVGEAPVVVPKKRRAWAPWLSRKA